MHLGGAERALIGLLHAFDYEKVEVDLFLNRHEGELLGDIPNEVNLLPENSKYKSLAEPIKSTIKRGEILVAFGRAFGKFMAKIKSRGTRYNSGITGEYSNKYTKVFMPKINSETTYDLAISFMTPHYFAAEKVSAKKRIAWIHTDYSKISLDVKSQLKMWGKYDYIASISDDVGAQFVKIFPEFKDKLVKIENIIPETLVTKQADTQIEPLSGEIKLLSIGRYSYAKNFENVPEICKKIREKGLNVTWYLIGYGDYEKLIYDAIISQNMQEYVIMLGKKENPYPYVKSCDLYVQPSRFEGNCVSVREAQLLGKPVVITNYETAKSQLEDGVDGIIVPMDNEGCADGIAELLKNPAKMAELSGICKKRDYTNRREVEKIYALMEG